MIIYSVHDLDDMKVIKWRLTDFCNYHCSYCIRRPIADPHTLEEDMSKSLNAVDEVVRIAERLNYRFGVPVKIDLIGGEVSCSDVTKEIVKKLGFSDAIGKINITTNLSRNIDWYTDLIENSKKKISITASFHPEEADLKTYLNKALILSKLCQFKCETVITQEATHIDEFVNFCEQNKIYYMCEENLFDESLRGQARRNTKQNYRYLVKTDEGNKYFYTRNEFIKQYAEDGIAFNTQGYKCTMWYDYVYVDRATVISCMGKVPIEKFKLLMKEHACPRGKCSLCGHLSLL